MIGQVRRALRSVLSNHPGVLLRLRRVYCGLGFGTRLEEDYLFELAREQRDVYFLQVGANDGVAADPLNFFVAKYGWKGIALEPLPDIFEKLQDTYRNQKGVTPICAAMGAEEGNLTFYRVQPGPNVPAVCELLGSFRRDVILSHKGTFPEIEQHLITQDVQVLSFAKLVHDFNVRRIDVVLIDAEGYDYEILKQIDFHRFHPHVIIYERCHLDETTKRHARQILDDAGYDVHDVLSMNCVAVARQTSPENTPSLCESKNSMA